MSKFILKQARTPGMRSLWIAALVLLMVVGSFLATVTTTPSAEAATKKKHTVTPSWSPAQQPILGQGYPGISARADGTIGISAAGNGAAFAYHRPSDSNYNIVNFNNASNKSGWSTGIYDGSGNFHMAWQDLTGSGYHIFYSKIDPNGNILINAVDLNNSSSALSGVGASGLPALAVRSDGRLYMAMEQAGFNIGVIESDDGGNTWINNRIIGNAGKGGVSNPHITVDKANGLHVIFIGNVGRDILAADSDSNGNFATAVFLDNNNTQGRAFFPSIATSPATGDVFGVWQEDAPSAFGTGAISLARWDSASKKWQPELQDMSGAGPGTLSDNTPTVTIDGDGIVWVMFRANSGNTIKFQFTTSTDSSGSAFNPVGDILGPVVRGANAPTTSAYSNGRVYFAAQTDVGNGFGVSVTSSPAGSGSGGTPPPTPAGCPTSVQPVVNQIPLGQGAYTYNLPFLANNSAVTTQTKGCFTTFVALQNTGSTPAVVSFYYFDQAGHSVQVPDQTCKNSPIPVSGECVPLNPFTAGNYGSGVIFSSQPLNVIVSEATPAGGSAYPVSAGATPNLVAPFAINNAYGGFVTQLTVFNPTASAASVSVSFFDASGNIQSNAIKSFTIPAFTSNILDQTAQNSNLPSGFNGWAMINSSNGVPLVAQVLEQNPNNNFVAIANAQIQPAAPVTGTMATLYAPAIYNGAFGGYVTGASLINSNPTTTTVNLTYYDSTGAPTRVAPFAVSPNSIVPIYSAGQGTGLPANGLPGGFNGSATISATNGVLMVVNEKFPGGSGTYAASTGGKTTVGLPAIANGFGGFVSGLTILNTSGQQVTGNIQYYDVNGVPTGTQQTFTIAANASQQYFQGSGGGSNLPAGFYGTAIVTQTAGSNSLIVTTNVVSPSFFYTYNEPS